MPERDLTLAAETLRAAEYLLNGGYYNDAISRAYYAMFYAARALLASRDLHPKGHKGLIIFVRAGVCQEGFY